MKNRHPSLFILAFIPGANFLVQQRFFLAVFYSLLFYGPLALALLIIIMGSYHPEPAFLLMLWALFIWLIQSIHASISLVKHTSVATDTKEPQVEKNDRVFITMMSFIPGLGHLQLGLMNRGLTFMVGFFGLITLIFFLSVFTSQGGFFVFLGLLPVIWIYNMFDTIQQLNRKQNGEELIDQTIMEDFESQANGKKSKTVTTLLAIFPGAGHLYLGLQRRGIQLMAAFLLAIFIMDFLRLSMFLFLIPLIWFYSFFDALQKANRYQDGEVEDEPIVSAFVNYQRWIGIGLIVLGIYYLFDRVLLSTLAPYLMNGFKLISIIGTMTIFKRPSFVFF